MRASIGNMHEVWKLSSPPVTLEQRCTQQSVIPHSVHERSGVANSTDACCLSGDVRQIQFHNHFVIRTDSGSASEEPRYLHELYSKKILGRAT